MSEPRRSTLRRVLTPAGALALIVVAYFSARLPDPGPEERGALARRFRFVGVPLPEAPGTPRSIREVNPHLARIRSWISSVGAGVSLFDVDGDRIANDLVLVDPRTDSVRIMPCPGTGARYSPVTLSPLPLAFDATMAPMGALAGDFDEDGAADVLVTYWGRSPIVFRQQGRLRFEPRELLTPPEAWYTNAATQADVDGDGHLDLVFGNYFHEASRILDPGAETRASMHASMSRADNGGRNRLFLWDADADPRPGFRDASDALTDGQSRRWTLAVGAADLDGDLLPELYFANDFGPDALLHNRSRPGIVELVPLHGTRRLTDPKSTVLGRDSFKGMGVDFGELNGDGLLDLFVSNIAQEYALEESHLLFLSTGETDLMLKGVAPYHDHSERLGVSRSGWGWDARMVDLDNDGTLEIFQATGFVKGRVDRWPELQELAMANDGLVPLPETWFSLLPGDDLSGHQRNPLFARAASGRYVEIGAEVGLGLPHVTRGITVGDVDRDGDQDLVIANQWERSFLYRNDSPGVGSFLGLDLLLPLDDRAPTATRVVSAGEVADRRLRPAIGAQASITSSDGRRLLAQVDGGSGHGGQRSPEVFFGLGAHQGSLRVSLRWRDREGASREDEVVVTPGWHCVVLGRGEGGGTR